MLFIDVCGLKHIQFMSFICHGCICYCAMFEYFHSMIIFTRVSLIASNCIATKKTWLLLNTLRLKKIVSFISVIFLGIFHIFFYIFSYIIICWLDIFFVNKHFKNNQLMIEKYFCFLRFHYCTMFYFVFFFYFFLNFKSWEKFFLNF